MIQSTANCRTCGAAIDTALDTTDAQTPCQSCGSTERNFNVSIVESATLRDGIGMKVKRVGERRAFRETKGIPSFSYSLEKFVLREQVIDRDKDVYFEKVTDYEDDRTIHHCEERLSEHKGHGSAKKKS